MRSLEVAKDSANNDVQIMAGQEVEPIDFISLDN